MNIFRLTHVNFEKIFNVYKDLDTLDLNEWENAGRLKEDGWMNRYQYESQIIREIVTDNQVKTILELGSGPGMLSQFVQKDLDLNYHLVDKPFAQKYFVDNHLKGKFFIKDISMDLDTEGLLPKYNLIICNDVLEHLISPSNIIRKAYSLMDNDSVFFISVPNWRMGHQFIYRGLWDYDNFLYFMYIHQFESIGVYPSPLQTPFYPKIDAEKSMPDELIQSWNFYFQFKKKP